MNDEMKDVERWNDPAAAFLTVRNPRFNTQVARLEPSKLTAFPCSQKKKEKSSKGPKYPTYQGPPPPPNRFGIRPGYRWDGVDRGNGFEKRLMERQNARSMHGAAAHAWSVEDM